RYATEGAIKRVVSEISETAGMEKKIVLLSNIWNYDLAHKRFCESGISSSYRDRLALVSGRSPKEIIEEIKLRTKILLSLCERNINDIKEVTYWCNRYLVEPKQVLEELAIKF
ncbi:MAG: hypothetical protein N2Z79_00320, partial [Candidatus Omnitrophica bacterium]|nr:hypothetical protein [Candidatus Omnitrophota bacterium]